MGCIIGSIIFGRIDMSFAIKAAIVSMVGFFSLSAFADGWEHRTRTGTDGTEIKIDYFKSYHPDRSYKPQNQTKASAVWVNVEIPNVTGSEKVRVVLNNYETRCDGPFDRSNSAPYTYIFDLRFENGRFTGQASEGTLVRSYLDLSYEVTWPFTIHSDGYAGNQCNSQTVSVVVDGQWLVDPVSKTNDFGVNLFAE
jgi:hypothetical protein